MDTRHKTILILAFLVAGALFTTFSFSWSAGPNYRNVSVDTRVNITQAPPSVLNVIISDNVTSPIANITLNAGSFKNITCNSTVRDYNGGGTITNVSAVFYKNGTAWDAADDNNTHYSNTNCTLGASDAYTRNVSCGFAIQYYADSFTWTCNVTATDSYNFGNTSRFGWNSNTTFINALLALNVTTLIDYGDLATGDLAPAQQANVTNLGNQNINVSVRGYGSALNDGLAMVCDIGNISVQHEKYNLIGGSDPTAYTNLSITATRIGGLTVQRQTNDSQQVLNTTYWTLYVPPGPFGRCNGTVVFQAETS